jgi:DNA-binding response OmpR family regulator
VNCWVNRPPDERFLEEATLANILVIDDDPAMRRMIDRILTGAGHQVTEAVNGVDGMKKFRAAAPEIVVTDIVMPDQEGIETIMKMRATGSRIGIIAISGGGHGSAGDYLLAARGLGADAILAKPFRPDELTALVEHLLVGGGSAAGGAG